ncbi:MAG: hypothetical protein ACREFW_03780 [Rhizomicrobium sp.]
MTPSRAAEPRARLLSAHELAFLILTILFWAGFVIVLGKDTSWDFRNYHWYAPYAFLNHREGLDVAVAHQATYYNPLLDIPFYWLATHTHSWIALLVLGAAQGANVVPLYLIAREGLAIADRKIGAGALALLGQVGALTLSMFGTTYYDNVMSVFVLSGLAILIINRRKLKEGAPFKAAGLAALAGFLTGCAFGLKLPEMPFCIGFAAALVALGGSPGRQTLRLFAGGVGGLVGFALFSGWWMLHMMAVTGNPLFPYFNEYWRSPLALPAPYRDMRFIPRHFWRQILFPFLFSLDWHVADDLGFQDIRILVAYLTVIPASLIWLFRRESKDALFDKHISLVLFAFAAASYVVWIHFFAIYRYILLLEMLSPTLIVAAVGLFPLTRRRRYLILAALGFAILVTARSDFLDRAPVDDPYIQVALPPIPHPNRTMVLMTGDTPMGFIAPSLPHQIPILRIDGWMVRPKDGTLITRNMKRRVARHLREGGDLYLMADATDMGRARDALADYGLAIRWAECQQFDTNLVGTYQWCPLARRT